MMESLGRRFAIPDIHGCWLTFKRVLERIGLEKNDSLYLLGDYIDRGPSSSDVLDMIISLRADGYNIHPLRGNHEQMLLDAGSVSSFFHFPDLYRGTGMVDHNNMIFPAYRELLEGLPYYIELDDFFLVHAGFNTSVDDPFSDRYTMITTYDFRYDARQLKGKRVIHGHAPTDLDVIVSRISGGSDVIPLDNGVCFSGFGTKGNLVCLNIDKMELLIQENIDM